MKRLLCIISCMNAGGAETFLMKLYRAMDRTKYQMDFCINVQEPCFYEKEIEAMGGRIYRIPAKSANLKLYKKQLAEVVKQGQYKHVLRITANAAGFMDLKIARKAGATVCAARSSNSSNGAGWKRWLAHRLGRLLYGRYVNVKIAPSDLAAQYTFGKKAYEAGDVAILQNAVDLNVVHYDPAEAQKVREEFGISEDTLLIGHVGRFATQKNHGFLLEVFREITKRCPQSKLILVGEGELEQQIREQIAALDIAGNVIFAGVRSDVPRLLSAMDVFLFPSLFEGMPNTVIEAQATGLPCVISDTITREADITGLVEYLPLTQTPAKWAEEVLAKAVSARKDTKAEVVRAGYEISAAAEKFVQLIFDGEKRL